MTKKEKARKTADLRDNSTIRDRFAWELSKQPNTASIPHMAAYPLFLCLSVYKWGRRRRRRRRRWVRNENGKGCGNRVDIYIFIICRRSNPDRWFWQSDSTFVKDSVPKIPFSISLLFNININTSSPFLLLLLSYFLKLGFLSFFHCSDSLYLYIYFKVKWNLILDSGCDPLVRWWGLGLVWNLTFTNSKIQFN